MNRPRPTGGTRAQPDWVSLEIQNRPLHTHLERDRDVVGLVFDGNIQSLGGDFGFDPAANRMVMVNVGMLREALSKVYHAGRIADELAK